MSKKIFCTDNYRYVLYFRGRCGELINLWQFVGMERGPMARAYYEACKGMEGSKLS